MTDPESPLRALHDQFCKLTGRNYLYEQWRYDWHEFSKFYTAADLVLVYDYAQRINSKREKRYHIITTLAKLLDLKNFDGLKSDAELEAKAKAAKARAFSPTAGQVALADMRHEEVPTGPDKPAQRVTGDMLAEMVRKAVQ